MNRVKGNSPNETIRVGCVGFHGQGRTHIKKFSGMRNVEVAALCDVDERVLNEWHGKLNRRPTAYTDVRRLIEDKSIDVVSIATPNHWHALIAIWACQAGKDVYVEKPCSHNIFEARQLVAAARKYQRVVQHGTQIRSSAAIKEAVHRMREGLIGDVYMARGLCYKRRNTIGHTPESTPPAGVHYDLWLGPAPARPFSRNRFHYNWHWQWDFGNGDIGNQGIHQLDVARWGLGVRYPRSVLASGGHFLFDDDQETPNTEVATFDFGNKMLVFEVRHWHTNREAGIKDRWTGNTVGNIFYGSKGYLVVNGYEDFKTYLGREQAPGPAAGKGGDHFEDFIDAVRRRDPGALNAEIEEGAVSTILMHLANISYRLGRRIQFDENTLSCQGDEEANALFTRRYRAPFVVPDQV